MLEILKMEKITKIYPGGVVANYEVDFSLYDGEIHALVGENGAGKSTLMKILYGMEKPTEGKIIMNDKEMSFNSSFDAIANGIGMVHQHFMLVPSLTVAENIVLGNEVKKGVFLDKAKAVEEVKALSEKYNLPINPNAKVMDISVSQKQKVEILKTLYKGAKILILDEPTAVLTPQEIEELFEQLLMLRNNGHTIVFISHKLHEIKQICDRLTVMRDGLSKGVYDVNGITEEEISRLMVGRDIKLDIDKPVATPKEVLLKLEEVSFVNEIGKKKVDKVSFSLRRGEILGIAGIEGNGQTELINIITGMEKLSEGKIFINNIETGNSTVRQIRESGLSHIPEDRMHTGIGEGMSVMENCIVEKYRDKDVQKYSFFLDYKKIRAYAKDIIKNYNVKTDSEDTAIKSLSGGNIQKVVVGRECSQPVDVLVINQPTRGIDVGAIEFIRKKIIALRDEGKAILLVSADLNEVMSLSDTLLVMSNGEIVARFEDTKSVDEFELGLYMLGTKKQETKELEVTKDE